MIYNDFKGIKLSALGMGCMRFPVDKTDDSKIDLATTREMIKLCFDSGINYFDTAWVYHGGNSESVLGELLSEYKRESYYLATKFPGFDEGNLQKVEEIFEAQLKKCKVDYFDFYLFHNVSEKTIEGYLDQKYGVYEYLMEQKRNGRIRHLGFSTHASEPTFNRFLSAYGKDMEFCQIQLNWLDWDFQKANEKVKRLNELNIPIWVMEPVRGGSLANLKPEYLERLNGYRNGVTPAEWAFRFVQSIDGVTVTLSGMSNLTQLKENINTFSERKPLTKEEKDALFAIATEMTTKTVLPCTACRYCVPKCPKKLDIPWMIELYNEHSYSGGGFIAPMALSSLEEGKRPTACIGCKACEKVCPQNIKISEMMTDFTKRLR